MVTWSQSEGTDCPDT